MTQKIKEKVLKEIKSKLSINHCVQSEEVAIEKTKANVKKALSESIDLTLAEVGKVIDALKESGKHLIKHGKKDIDGFKELKQNLGIK
jgi:hypothetical protein